MAGAVCCLLDAGHGGGGAGVVIPGALEWTDAFGTVVVATNVQTLTLITVPISIVAGITGGGTLHYALNGVGHAYVGAFNVSAGDTLVWSVINVTASPVSGTINVTNASNGGAVLDAPTYTATGT